MREQQIELLLTYLNGRRYRTLELLTEDIYNTFGVNFNLYRDKELEMCDYILSGYIDDCSITIFYILDNMGRLYITEVDVDTSIAVEQY